jgi:hypothetical protein
MTETIDILAGPKPLTIIDAIKIVLPDGTRGTGRWDAISEWPPDLFATAASITERSGLYSQQIFTSYWVEGFAPDKSWIDRVRAIGDEWAETASPPGRAKALWRQLVGKYGNAPIEDSSPDALEWKRIVFDLLVIADEACAGVGFPPTSADEKEGHREKLAPKGKRTRINSIQYIVYEDYVAWSKYSSDDQDRLGGDVLPHLPVSLCIHVPRGLLCVQPKATTPAVGCTLRSLTHNIALLPSVKHVRTSWIPTSEARRHNDPFNILVVPFPFSIPGGSFSAEEGRFPAGDRVFSLDPDKWMNRDPSRAGAISAAEFADFLCGLMDQAKSELEPVHAVVLPETAIRFELANEVAEILAAKTGLDLFVAGVLSRHDGIRNLAGIYRFLKNKVVQRSFQSKHHRWGLDGSQIRRYHLGHVLDPHCKWWEKINVGDRASYISSFRSYAMLSVLVCEDLARYDPVLTVMNAIGPNLVIALLMDGPQLEHRWPGRYATVLADDPGSAVLTVTSFGMVCRSRNPGEQENREIALWKEPNGRAQVLKLPRGSHGLLLTLTNRLVEQFTLDSRGDGGMTMQFALGAAHGITHPNPPAWIGSVP